MNIKEFITCINKYKAFRELPEQYKTDRFIKLYFRMYNYIISIPKEKIVIANILKRNNYVQYLFSYIYKFIEAKDFYKWKERIYSLVTEKLCSISKRRFELLYRSKAKEYFNQYLEKYKTTCMKNYGVKHPFQSKEIHEKAINTWKKNYGSEIINPSQVNKVKEKVSNNWKNKTKEEKEQIQEKSKATCMKNHGVEYPGQSKEVQEKAKETCMERYGVEHPLQSKEIHEKHKATCMERYGVEHPMQSKEVQEKYKATNLERYGVERVIQLYSNGHSHSRIGDEICQAIDNLLDNPEDSRYAIKNKEFSLKTIDNSIKYYDYCIPSKKIIVEIDDPYWHALDKDDNEIIKYPGNKIKLAKEIHEYDKEKEELAIKNGYKIFHIRDDEYIKDPKSTIDNLIKEIREVI